MADWRPTITAAISSDWTPACASWPNSSTPPASADWPNCPPKRDGLRKTLAAILDRANELGRLSDTLSAFVYAFFSTDSYNTTAAREMSKLELLGVRRQKLDVRLRAWIGSLSGTARRLDRRRTPCWASTSSFCATAPAAAAT